MLIIKGRFVRVQAMKVYRDIIRIAPLILNLSARWICVDSNLSPLPPGKNPWYLWMNIKKKQPK
jgi:hypothetical protein